jgi:hypothetical protein
MMQRQEAILDGQTRIVTDRRFSAQRIRRHHRDDVKAHGAVVRGPALSEPRERAGVNRAWESEGAYSFLAIFMTSS